MRIAIVAPLVTAITEPQLGGSQALLADIASSLTQRGHDVSVFAASGSRIDGVDVVDTGIDPEELRSTLFRAGTEDPDDAPAHAAFADVYRHVSKRPFDLIHNHAFDVPAFDLAPDDRPVVHTLHLPPRGAIADAIGRARDRARSVTAAAVSRFGAASWQSLVEIDVVLPNGVPVERIGFGADPVDRVLYAGRLSPEKGVAEAIAIARRAGIPIVVVGDPYDERYAAERVMPQRGPGVEVRAAVPRADLWRLMGSSRAVLCPALWDEPFGLVAAEAQAAGAPVVAFARGALGEVIRNGVTGALVEDVDEAADALTGVSAYDRAMCRAHAEEHLSLDRTVDAHEALYTRLVRAPVVS